MPLSDDQRAMLRLLAQREEGYEDIAALLGLSVDEVRARVKEALAELDEAGRPAVEEGRAPAPPPPPPGREPEPQPTPPPPAEPEPARPAPSALPRVPLPKDRRRITELVGGAVLVIVIVLFATGALDIGGGGSDSSSPDASTSPTGTAGAEGSKLTQAVLAPVSGGEASGRALFGRVGKEAVLQVTAQGLEPTSNGESYTIWLYRTSRLVLRVGAVKVGKSGRLGTQLPIPAELLAYVAGGAFRQIYVSRTSDQAFAAELAKAKKQKTLPRYTGATVLRGRITGPIVRAGNKSGG